ncbi:hypothetical protein HDU79_012074, partial [Rhizoclosmatium sp. JEL0117]
MKVLWVVFQTAGIAVPSLKSILKLRQTIDVVRPIPRTTRTGKQIYVRPLPDLIKRVFANKVLAPLIQRTPKPSENPKETFETQAYAQLAPKLSGLWNQTRLYAGDTLHILGGTANIISFSPDGKRVNFTFANDSGQSDKSLFFLDMTGPVPAILERGELSRRANGADVIQFPVILTTDETSGNKTKRYNKFESAFAIWAAMSKEYHTSAYINFLATTHDGSWRDVAEVVLEDLAH